MKSNAAFRSLDLIKEAISPRTAAKLDAANLRFQHDGCLKELELREVRLIRFKRVHIEIGGEDKAGHWWFEIGDPISTDAESYGWWPASPLSSWFQCLIGVDGRLNNGMSYCNPPQDPHHGEVADEEFFPLVRQEDCRTDEEIADCLRSFAANFRGKWQWFLG